MPAAHLTKPNQSQGGSVMPPSIGTSAQIVAAALAGRAVTSDHNDDLTIRVTVAELSSVSFLGTSSAQPQVGKRNMSSLVISTALVCKSP